jgi:ParB/RepB/Spo0J family partition protein
MPRYELIQIECLLEPEIPAREAMDETKLYELRDSIAEVGYIHPLAVVVAKSRETAEVGAGGRKRGRGAQRPPERYEIIDGHRRYKCGVMLQHKTLPCLIFDDPDNAREAIKLHTALYREDLSTAEEAAFIADLINRYDYTEEQLCRALRQKVSWVNERLALLHGNKDVFDALRERKINLAVAKQLNRVKDESQTRVFLALVVEGGATALTVGKWVSEWLQKKSPAAGGSAPGPTPLQVPLPAPVGPVCFICGKEDNAYSLENVWIHPWEKKMIEAQIERALPPAIEELTGDKSGNGKAN